MNNLFTIFDPKSWMSLTLNWMSAFLCISIIPSLFWVAASQAGLSVKLLMKAVTAEFKAVVSPTSSASMLLPALALFVFILLNNVFGLLPNVFTASSHMVFTVNLALPLWLGHIQLALLKSPISMLSHLVPLGTPLPLMPFMVIIEFVSNMIRPLTLSVRLAANMIAGHLLLALLSGQAPNSNYAVWAGVMAALVLLGVLECAVSVIQSYVFSVLTTLYMNEAYVPKLD